MPHVCVVGGCSITNVDYTVFSFPSDDTFRSRWDKFIMKTRADWHIGQGKSTTDICALHFTGIDLSKKCIQHGNVTKLLSYKHNFTCSDGVN